MISTYGNKYHKNDTMELIGAQRMELLANGGYGGLKQVAEAYGLDSPPNIMWDAFQLGVIYGKRAERIKRKRKSAPR